MRERFVLEEVRHNANATMLAYVSWHRWIAKKKNACGIKSVRFASKLCNMYTLN